MYCNKTFVHSNPAIFAIWNHIKLIESDFLWFYLSLGVPSWDLKQCFWKFPQIHSTKVIIDHNRSLCIVYYNLLSLLRMANPWPTKCQRPDPGTSYHDPVPLLNDDFDFDTIHSCEGRLKRVSGLGGLGTAALPQDPHHGTSWSSVYSWDPPDDSEFALDPNGDLYDDLIEGDVMEELISPDNPSKKKRSKVSVSFVYSLMKWTS